MKVELDFLQRAYVANLLRIRATAQRELAESRTMSATREELIAEAKWCDAQARKLDDAFEEKSVSEKEPIRVDARRDIDSIDKPATNGGGS